MTGLPQLTQEARSAALGVALANRRERSQVLAGLKDGSLTLEQVLGRDDAVVANTPVRRLIASLPGIGKVRADQVMADLAISHSRRVQGLGPRQRASLLERFPAQD